MAEKLSRQRAQHHLRRGERVERTETLASTCRVLAVQPAPRARS